MAAKKRSLVYLLLATLAVLLSALTAVVFMTMERYTIGEPSFIANTTFDLASDDLLFEEPVPVSWERLGRQGHIGLEGQTLVIDNDNTRVAVGLEQTIELPKDIRTFEISANIELQLAIGGAEPWQRARVDFIGTRIDGSRDYSRPHKLFDAVGTRPDFRYRRIVEIAPDITQARLSLRLARTTGRMLISDLELRPAIERPEFTQMSMLVRGSWLAFILIAGGWFCATAAHRPAAAGAVALIFVGGLFALMPYEVKEPFMDLISPFTHSADADERAWTDRAIHVLAFMALGFLVRLARRRDPIRNLIIPLAAVAIVVELIQSASTGIGFDDLLDVGTNLFGLIVGLGVGQDYVKRHYRRRRSRRRKRRRKDPETGHDQPIEETRSTDPQQA